MRLFDFFWKELELRGARVYEPEDYERAIELARERRLPLERLITKSSRSNGCPQSSTSCARPSG